MLLKLFFKQYVYIKNMAKTFLLLTLSNIFMTIAWYGFLKVEGIPIWKAIVISWAIAFFEYCLMVPANRHGYIEGMSSFQLKISQEVISLIVFTIFAVIFLKDPLKLNYVLSFICILGAVYFAFKR